MAVLEEWGRWNAGDGRTGANKWSSQWIFEDEGEWGKDGILKYGAKQDAPSIEKVESTLSTTWRSHCLGCGPRQETMHCCAYNSQPAMIFAKAFSILVFQVSLAISLHSEPICFQGLGNPSSSSSCLQLKEHLQAAEEGCKATGHDSQTKPIWCLGYCLCMPAGINPRT